MRLPVRLRDTLWSVIPLAMVAALVALGIASAAEGDKKDDQPKENLGQRRVGDVGTNEELGFKQSKISTQMLELEERMYRLSEALKGLEPENASRLLIGLKYAREELIQLQMKEIQQALATKKYNDASVEQKTLITKLRRLEQLLLSPDLDFQLQLERLRLMRELMQRLDAAIQEEEREQTASGQSVEREKELPELRRRIAALAELIQRQTGHNETTAKLLGEPSPLQLIDENAPADALNLQNSQASKATPPSAEDIAALTEAQQQTRELTKPLEPASEHLVKAGQSMEQAGGPLKAGRLIDAKPSQIQAILSLKRAEAEWKAEEQQLEAALSQEKFAAMQKDQAANRKTTEGISEAAVQLGDAGAVARNEMLRGAGSMSSAESSLGGRQAGSAGMAQGEAVAALKAARQQLAAEAERLLNRLRAEIKKRAMEGIVQMLEGQIVIRQSTERLEPRLKDGGRTVLNSVVALAAAEQKLIVIGDGVTSLVEETEFGIALPAAIRSITEGMSDVKDRLGKGEASAEVAAAEKQIEEDLEALLAAMKQMPTVGRMGGQAGAGNRSDRERELNRLIAELKIVRMLQVRVNRDTKSVDGQRPAEVKSLPALLRQRIEALQGRQEDVHDVTERISLERGEELQQ